MNILKKIRHLKNRVYFSSLYGKKRSKIITNSFFSLFIKIIPFISTMFIGISLIIVAQSFFKNYEQIITQIGITLITIPFVFIFYEHVRNITNKIKKRTLVLFLKSKIDPGLNFFVGELSDILVSPVNFKKDEALVQRRKTILLTLNKKEISQFLNDQNPRFFTTNYYKDILEDSEKQLDVSWIQKVIDDDYLLNYINFIIILNRFVSYLDSCEIFDMPDQKNIKKYSDIVKFNLSKHKKEVPSKIYPCYIKENHCDILIDHFEELKNAINKITKGVHVFSV